MVDDKQQASHRGVSLVEALIVLTIFAVLVAAIWSSVASAYAKDKNRRLFEETIQIVHNIKGFYQGQQPSSGFSATTALAAGIFPSEMIVQTSPLDVRHPWAKTNSVDIKADDTDPTQMILTIDNVPGDGCVMLVSQLGGSAEAAQKYGLISISINENTLTAPITPVEAANFCHDNNVVDLSPLLGISTAYAMASIPGTENNAEKMADFAEPTQPGFEKMGIIFSVP